jgi:uncharacterized protein YlzI (FlbEa/FlbD family)
MTTLVKLNGFGREYYVNPAHVISVYKSCVEKPRGNDMFGYLQAQYDPCVMLETVKDTLYAVDEDIEKVIAKLTKVSE